MGIFDSQKQVHEALKFIYTLGIEHERDISSLKREIEVLELKADELEQELDTAWEVVEERNKEIENLKNSLEHVNRELNSLREYRNTQDKNEVEGLG